jgi:hypothetical protein
LSGRQSEIQEKFDLTKNQAPSQVGADSPDDNAHENAKTQDKTVRRAGMTV